MENDANDVRKSAKSRDTHQVHPAAQPADAIKERALGQKCILHAARSAI